MHATLATTPLFLGLTLAYGTTLPPKPYTTGKPCTKTVTAFESCVSYPCNVGPQPTTITAATSTSYEACGDCALTTVYEPVGACPVVPPSQTVTCPSAITRTATDFVCATCTTTATVTAQCPPACNVGKPKTVYAGTATAVNCGTCGLVTQTLELPCPAPPPTTDDPITCPATVTSTETFVQCKETPVPAPYY